jgi:hypothetical protein
MNFITKGSPKGCLFLLWLKLIRYRTYSKSMDEFKFKALPIVYWSRDSENDRHIERAADKINWLSAS